MFSEIMGSNKNINISKKDVENSIFDVKEYPAKNEIHLQKQSRMEHPKAWAWFDEQEKNKPDVIHVYSIKSVGISVIPYIEENK